jgi:hypothetical protein
VIQPDVFFEIACFGCEKKRCQLRFPSSAKRKADADGRLWGSLRSDRQSVTKPNWRRCSAQSSEEDSKKSPNSLPSHLFLPFGAVQPWPGWRLLPEASPYPTDDWVCRFHRGLLSPAHHSFPVHSASNTSGRTGGLDGVDAKKWRRWRCAFDGTHNRLSSALIGYLVTNCWSGLTPAF